MPHTACKRSLISCESCLRISSHTSMTSRLYKQEWSFKFGIEYYINYKSPAVSSLPGWNICNSKESEMHYSFSFKVQNGAPNKSCFPFKLQYARSDLLSGECSQMKRHLLILFPHWQKTTLLWKLKTRPWVVVPHCPQLVARIVLLNCLFKCCKV
jgi:hypothetical protein